MFPSGKLNQIFCLGAKSPLEDKAQKDAFDYVVSMYLSKTVTGKKEIPLDTWSQIAFQHIFLDEGGKRGS